MFVTKELKQQVEVYLQQIDRLSGWLAAAGESGIQWDEEMTPRLAAERALHVAIECVTDVGNLLIDALVMRDPGGYADIVRVLMEESVVPRAWFTAFEGAIAFRNRLIREYTTLRPAEVGEAVAAYGPLLAEFTESVRNYLATM
ncbi:MAG: DUF86 domain-containing protein [Alicyclobacillus sp.]|nr:DUF86 domain-containing protein [Alicyclobacillus sp.]